MIILIDLQRINKILRFQKEFKWVEKSPFYKDHKYYNNSLEAHAHKHPIKEKYTGKWNSLIKYDNYKTIIDSYNKASIDLSKKFDYISKGKYDLQYSYKHDSVNIVDLNNGLIVCLKYKDYSNCYNIATCYFPSKVDKLFSLRSYISDQNTISDINYIMLDNNNHNLDLFKEVMSNLNMDHTPYDCRSTTATKLYNAGVDQLIYKLILGHDVSDITEKHYIKITSSQKVKAINSFD